MQTTRGKWAALLHKKLSLKVDGKWAADGDWKKLMKVAIHYPDHDWEIVEKLRILGERIITKHSSLLHQDCIFLLKKRNNKGV